MLTVARTLMGNPLLVLLDEPSGRRGAADRRADGPDHHRVEETGPVDVAVRTECSFRPSWYRIASMCWKRARFTGRVRSQNSMPMWMSAKRILSHGIDDLDEWNWRMKPLRPEKLKVVVTQADPSEPGR